uniref:E3 ubiquitin-protein ligase RNF220 n=1 Tax=Neogobius melanostomus TaxID=47308 RepID=A0A8C6U617_9GOBI
NYGQPLLPADPLASPALMVLASTAEAGRDASVPCQAPRPFGVPTSMEKDLHLPFPSASYTFTSMYQRQGPLSGTFTPRDFPTSLLHLHPQFSAPNLDCSSLGMLSHSSVGAFRPFSSPPEERGGYHSAFSPAKRLKSCFPDVEGKEFDFGSSRSNHKTGEDSGRKLFSMSGLLSDGEASSSPEERKELSKYRLKVLYDKQNPVELQEHMEQELSKIAQLQIRLGLWMILTVYRCIIHLYEILTSTKDCRDSDADLDVDGDDTLEYGRAQYPSSQFLGFSCPCWPANNLICRGFINDCCGPLSHRSAPVPCMCRTSDDSLTTLGALKARIRELEKQLSKGDRFKCLICMDTYATPLTSIQCWHVHCEECWLRTLGAKKLCPQCNTITSPGDLRRVFL